MSMKSVDSGSIRKENPIFKVSAVIKGKRSKVRGSKPSFFTCAKIRSVMIKETRIVPHPMIPASALGIDFLNRPFSRNPISGSRGTRQISVFKGKMLVF